MINNSDKMVVIVVVVVVAAAVVIIVVVKKDIRKERLESGAGICFLASFDGSVSICWSSTRPIFCSFFLLCGKVSLVITVVMIILSELSFFLSPSCMCANAKCEESGGT